jgi:16S rRNA (uracil1498-N3)-methyltransferase
MNLPYFYEENVEQPIHVLSEETARHCIQVLRMKEGEQLQLTDGKGNSFTAIIITANKKNCEVRIEASSRELRAASNVAIAISLLKNSSRLEWFMEKATEIGISEIIPLICDHTEKQNFRFDRMQNILVSKRFDDFIREDFDGLQLIAHCAEGEKYSLSILINQHSDQNKLIVIGPEGDFSNEEIKASLEKKFMPVTLGNTRLRTETAGIVAATLLCNTL